MGKNIPEKKILGLNQAGSNADETGTGDNTIMAVYHLKENKEPAYLNHIALNKQVIKKRMVPINISTTEKAKNLSESLESEKESLIIYKMKDGIYYHQVEDYKSKPNFVNKISDIEIVEKTDDSNENKVILHFKAKRNRPLTSAEIKCTDGELKSLFNFLEKEKIIEPATPTEILNNFHGNMFYHSGITPEANAEIFADTDDDYPLFSAPFQDTSKYTLAGSENNAERIARPAMDKSKGKDRNKARNKKPDNANVIVNADQGATINIYNGGQRANNSNADTGESTVTPMQGVYYSTSPNRMQNITTHDIERSGYSVADTGNFTREAFIPNVPSAPISIPTPPTTPTPLDSSLTDNSAPIPATATTATPKTPEPAKKDAFPGVPDDFNPYKEADEATSAEAKTEAKADSQQKPAEKGDDKPSGAEVLLKELLLLGGIVAVGMVLFMGATLPFAGGIAVLGILSFAYNDGIIHGGKNVFSTSGQAFGKSYYLLQGLVKNYSKNRKSLKRRRLEAEMDQVQGLYKTDSVTDEKFTGVFKETLRNQFITDAEKKLPIEEQDSIAMIRYQIHSEAKKSLDLPTDSPTETSPYGNYVIPPKAQDGSKKFSQLTDLNPDAVDRDYLAEFVEGKGAIGIGEGSMVHNKNPYNRTARQSTNAMHNAGQKKPAKKEKTDVAKEIPPIDFPADAEQIKQTPPKPLFQIPKQYDKKYSNILDILDDEKPTGKISPFRYFNQQQQQTGQNSSNERTNDAGILPPVELSARILPQDEQNTEREQLPIFETNPEEIEEVRKILNKSYEKQDNSPTR
ncbi:MAG: hypothetical protein PHR96_01055 [Clostridia bacterium]|nr:hypothetical protein [Clostridia bacterium]